MNVLWQCVFLVILTQFCFIFYLQYTVIHNQKTIKHQHSITHEPIDVVYTWVNGSDSRFLRNLHAYTKSSNLPLKEDVNGDRRYAEKHELLYSLRSLERHMPWIRHVYIVTNGQIPSWLNLDSGHVTIVTHEQIFPNQSHLPTFSSPAIETNLHRIAGISRRFLYINDDWLMGAPIDYATFYTPTDGQLFYWAFAVPPCAHLCTWRKVGDGKCDIECYREECQMDGGDCNNLVNLTQQNLKKMRDTPPILETAYGRSLQHTQRLLNLRHGYRQRYVLPHSPMLIDTEVLASAWGDFPHELTRTSSHRFREGNDLQFEFFYTFYMLEKQKISPLKDTLLKYDANKDGLINEEELNVMLIVHYQNTSGYISETERDNFMGVLQQCATGHTLKVNDLSNCHTLGELLRTSLRASKQFKSLLLTKIPWEGFYLLGRLSSDLNFVVRELNNFIKYPRKFLSLNDDITHIPSMIETNRKVYKELALFYERLFPVPSKYELPEGKINPPDKYIQEINLEKSNRNDSLLKIYILLFFGFVFVILTYVILKMSCINRRCNRNK